MKKLIFMSLLASGAAGAKAAEPVWPEDFAEQIAQREAAVLPSAEATKSIDTTADYGAVLAGIALSQDCGTEALPFETRGIHSAMCSTSIPFSTMPLGFLLFLR
jgi:hypothetical protein